MRRRRVTTSILCTTGLLLPIAGIAHAALSGVASNSPVSVGGGKYYFSMGGLTLVGTVASQTQLTNAGDVPLKGLVTVISQPFAFGSRTVTLQMCANTWTTISTALDTCTSGAVSFSGTYGNVNVSRTVTLPITVSAGSSVWIKGSKNANDTLSYTFTVRVTRAVNVDITNIATSS
jgi:hypothetical protein